MPEKAGTRFTQRSKRRARQHPVKVNPIILFAASESNLFHCVIANNAAPPQTVEINPAVCFGLPVLKDSRLTTGFLASRHRGGDSVPSIAKSYGRPVAEIEEAIEWELGRPVKKAA